MPKISVLVPVYNRRHYIEDCINSVLIQTFQDFEIIVRDDGSTDGSADFVQQRYAAEISSGKLKLRRNEKNLGEHPTVNRLIRDATGKYIMILHSDDLYLLHALEHMYIVAEETQADVVHAGTFLQSPENGVIDTDTKFKVMCWENRVLKDFELVPFDSETRFKEWANADTFYDAQYNIFNRKFILDNEIFFPDWEANMLFCLHWLMTAKVYVKTPEFFYIRRDAPDSYTNDRKLLTKRIRQIISAPKVLADYFKKFFNSVEYFRNNAELQYHVQAIFYNRVDAYEMTSRQIYKNGVTPEIHRAVEDALKECFGENIDYLAFLFHKVHCLPFEKDYNKIVTAD